MPEYSPNLDFQFTPAMIRAPTTTFIFTAPAIPASENYVPTTTLRFPLMQSGGSGGENPAPTRTTGQLWPISA